MRYFVHDFLIEETSANKIKGCFFYHVSIYCSHNKKFVDGDLEKLHISVGNPDGAAHYLKIMQGVFNNSKTKSFFDGPFMIVNEYDEDEVMKLLKEKIENIIGINKRELLYNLSPYFQWEFLVDEEVVRKFFN